MKVSRRAALKLLAAAPLLPACEATPPRPPGPQVILVHVAVLK